VASAVTVETVPTVLKFMEEQGYRQVEAVTINVAQAKPVGKSHIWQGQNPVTIISGQYPSNS
jgi:precorrin-6B methylase 2